MSFPERSDNIYVGMTLRELNEWKNEWFGISSFVQLNEWIVRRNEWFGFDWFLQGYFVKHGLYFKFCFIIHVKIILIQKMFKPYSNVIRPKKRKYLEEKIHFTNPIPIIHWQQQTIHSFPTQYTSNLTRTNPKRALMCAYIYRPIIYTSGGKNNKNRPIPN